MTDTLHVPRGGTFSRSIPPSWVKRNREVVDTLLSRGFTRDPNTRFGRRVFRFVHAPGASPSTPVRREHTALACLGIDPRRSHHRPDDFTHRNVVEHVGARPVSWTSSPTR